MAELAENEPIYSFSFGFRKRKRRNVLKKMLLFIVNTKTRDVKILTPQKDVFYQLAQTEIVQRDTKKCVDTKKVANFKRISAVNTYTKQWSIVIVRMRIIYPKVKVNN